MNAHLKAWKERTHWPPTYYGVICKSCGRIPIGKDNYNKQMNRPDSRWRCPQCGDSPVAFDDILYECSESEDVFNELRSLRTSLKELLDAISDSNVSDIDPYVKQARAALGKGETKC